MNGIIPELITTYICLGVDAFPKEVLPSLE